jgi:hypothetical protein
MRWDLQLVVTTWISAVALAVAPATACTKGAERKDAEQTAAPPAGACDETLRRAEEALRVVEPAVRLTLAAAAVAESCPGLPASARSAFQLISGVMDDERPLVIARAVADHPDVWLRACSGGPAAFAEVGAAAPAEKAGILVERCGLAAGGDLGTEVELRAADGMNLALALLLRRFLVDGGVEPALARTLGRAVLGR